MPIVLDANVTVDWFLPNMNDVASTALDVLRRLDLAGKLTQSVDVICGELRELPISVDDELTSVFGDEAAVSTRYNLTVYDAAYLELAIRLHAPLATNDQSLVAAVQMAKLPPIR